MVDPVSFGPVGPVRGRKDATVETKSARAPERDTSQVLAPSLPKLLRLAAELASQSPPINTAKIAAIRQSIATGSYKVDPYMIADAMIAHYGGRIA